MGKDAKPEIEDIYGTIEVSMIPGFITYQDDEDITDFPASAIGMINTDLTQDEGKITEISLFFNDPDESVVLGLEQSRSEVLAIIKESVETRTI